MKISVQMAADPLHPRHGTVSGYFTGHCRCDRCRTAAAESTAAYRAQQLPLSPEDSRHGTLYCYGVLRCRCDLCTQARRNYAEVEKKRRRQQAESAGTTLQIRRAPTSICTEEVFGALMRFLVQEKKNSRADYTAWRATQDWDRTPSAHAVKTLLGSFPEAIEQAQLRLDADQQDEDSPATGDEQTIDLIHLRGESPAMSGQPDSEYGHYSQAS